MIVLAWYEAHTIGAQYTWMDRFVRYHDAELRLIDTIGQFLPREPGRLPIAYRTLDEALADMGDYDWVFMSPDGPIILDEYIHPTSDNVVYAFGSDHTGFGQGVSGFGDVVRLRKEEEIFAVHVIPYTLYDRAMSLAGKR